MNEPIAHSAKPPIGEQPYSLHVGNVLANARRLGLEATEYSPTWRNRFMPALEMSAAYHDLGKLDSLIQEDMQAGQGRLRLNHVDAGTAYLLREKHAEAAVAVYSHHLGLPSFPAEKAKNANGAKGMFRDLEGTVGNTQHLLHERTDSDLDEYLNLHEGHGEMVSSPPPKPGFPGLVRRLLLSCLVDADHSDTAHHYGNLPQTEPPTLRASERLQALDEYVDSLQANARPSSEREVQRQHLRNSIYEACRQRKITPGDTMLACDSPVGTGKTTAIMAHLLRVAHERGLRRIFVVLPFTNVIDQSVETYRKALALPGEDEEQMETVVAAVHHRVEFASPSTRHLAATWDAPIVVTTAVQFFETLAACHTPPLRKLHQLPGSAVFVDESHAAMPPALWPQMFEWLRELCMDWFCHVVLASGTLPRFWQGAEFGVEEERTDLPDLVPPEIREQADTFEERRINVLQKESTLSLDGLAHAIQEQPGPRLVILNTVQSAAVVAHHLKSLWKDGREVEHLSTALSPNDREKTIRRIKNKLKKGDREWCLVATSCVEAGVDFSFRTAFRESCGLMNLLQAAGRVSRSGEYEQPAIWDFRHDGENGLTLHPQFKLSRKILSRLFQQAHDENRQPTPEDVTEAWRLELRQDRGVTASRMEEIRAAENADDYPEVARLCRLISADTRTVVVEPSLVERLEQGAPDVWPRWKDIMNGSVQIWANKLDELPIAPLSHVGEIYRLTEGAYDPFLGWMACMLPRIDTPDQGLPPICTSDAFCPNSSNGTVSPVSISFSASAQSASKRPSAASCSN